MLKSVKEIKTSYGSYAEDGDVSLKVTYWEATSALMNGASKRRAFRDNHEAHNGLQIFLSGLY